MSCLLAVSSKGPNCQPQKPRAKNAHYVFIGNGNFDTESTWVYGLNSTCIMKTMYDVRNTLSLIRPIFR